MYENQTKRSQFLSKLFKREGTEEMTDAFADSNVLIGYFQSFVKNHPDIVFVISPEGSIISNNEREINYLLGHDSKKQMNLLDFVSKEEHKLLITAFQKARNGKGSRLEFTIDNVNQQRLYVEGTYIPINKKKSEVDGVIFILKDITEKKQLEMSNILKQHHLEQTQEISEIGSWEYYINEDQFNCSETCYILTGYDKMTVLTEKSLLSLIHPEDQTSMRQLFMDAIHKGTGFFTEFRMYHAGTNALLHLQIKVDVVYQNGRPHKLIGVFKNNTQYKLVEKNVKDAYEGYQYIFNHLDVGIWMSDLKDDKFSFVSEGLSNIYAMPLTTIYEQDDILKRMVLDEDKDALFAKYELLKAGHTINHRYRIINNEGIEKWIYEQVVPRRNNAGEITHVFGMKLDMTKEMESIEQLHFLTEHDRVTGLPNHYSLYEATKNMIKDERIEKFSVMYINLDNFDLLSHYLGHHFIDKLLSQVTSTILNHIPNDGYLAKVANSSYILLSPNFKEKNDIFMLAEQIIDLLTKNLIVNGYDIYLIVSIGISFYPENGEDELSIIENAYSALYHAKDVMEANYQVYSTEKDIQSHRKYMLEIGLRQAIKYDGFDIHYQPQVNPHNGKIEVLEALLRWNHKDWGTVSPKEFIALAEEKHLIHHIGEWVIHKVCQQIYKWKQSSYEIPRIAINISPIHILKTDLFDTIQQALQKYAVEAKYLEIEITESVLLKNEQIIDDTLQKLRSLGVTVALDDFGSGFASFHYLQKFDIDKIKIDQSFIHYITQENTYNTKEAAIVSAFLHLAKGLNISIVAEGVETYEQLEFLRQNECHLVQGYIYARPVPAQELVTMLKKRYIQPKKSKQFTKPPQERRKYFRYIFPYHVIAKMEIVELGYRKESMGRAIILIENISLGGLRFLSALRLPINKKLKLKFYVKLLDIHFEFVGSLVYINEEMDGIFFYGVTFDIKKGEQDRLSKIINQLSVIKELNKEMLHTDVVRENPYAFLLSST